jgi:hypothetical protein
VPFVSTTSTVVDDLTPGSVYQFRVSANNVVGISKPSPPTEPVTLDIGNGECDFVLVFCFLFCITRDRVDPWGKFFYYNFWFGCDCGLFST